MDIPDVAFRPSDSGQDTIELVELTKLYDRRASMDHDPENPHRLDFHMLVHIKQGEGSHFIDFQRHAFQDDSFIFLTKGQVHAFDLTQRPDGIAILFTDGFVDELQANMRVPLFSPMHPLFTNAPVFTPVPELSASCAALLAEIRKEASKEDHNMLILMFLFSSLLLMLAREANRLQSDALSATHSRRFLHFVQMLEAGFTETRDASNYAEQMHITYKSLNALCKRATGNTAKQLIDDYVVLEAKRRLTLKKLPIQQLAFELGFEDTSNFIKYFKRFTRETPSQFQKRMMG